MLKFFGWTQSDNTETTIPGHSFIIFYAFEMALAIVFLRENAVEAIKVFENTKKKNLKILALKGNRTPISCVNGRYPNH